MQPPLAARADTNLEPNHHGSHQHRCLRKPEIADAGNQQAERASRGVLDATVTGGAGPVAQLVQPHPPMHSGLKKLNEPQFHWEQHFCGPRVHGGATLFDKTGFEPQ